MNLVLDALIELYRRSQQSSGKEKSVILGSVKLREEPVKTAENV